jgi:large subunit ribosomal protein L15
MVVKRERKHRKFRGHRAQGYGSHKKHRGGGSRGGRGKAGMHKHKWSYTVKYEPDHFGKYGFKPQGTVIKIEAINLKQIDKQAEKLLQEKLAAKEGELIRIDVTKLGYGKVLGGGQLRNKLIIEARSFSEEAKRKIEETGGQAIVVERKAKKKAEEEVKELGKKVEEEVEKKVVKLKTKTKQKAKVAKNKK